MPTLLHYDDGATEQVGTGFFQDAVQSFDDMLSSGIMEAEQDNTHDCRRRPSEYFAEVEVECQNNSIFSEALF